MIVILKCYSRPMTSPTHATFASPRARRTGNLVLEDLWLDYDGVAALSGVSVQIEENTITALAGPNGSGKSTLLSVLAGLLAPRRGKIGLPAHCSTALVVQRSMVSERMPLTVRDVVTMGRWARKGLWRPLREEDRRIVDESILRVGLSDCERRPLHSLSGGQRQRAFVGQGIAQQADIFLLDEPTTGLDVESQDRIAGILLAEKERGATVVYASHDEAALSAADSVLQLRAGRLASEGDGCAWQ